MASKHTLTITELATLAGIPHAKNIRATVVTNLPKGEALIDTTSNEIMAGGESIKLTNGTGAIDLPATDATDLNVVANTVQYEVRAEYVDPATRGRETWRSGYFALTGDANLADVATDASPMAVASASAYALEAEAARDGAVAIAGPVDATVAGLIKNSGGIGPLTQGALDTAYAPVFTAEAEGAVGSGDDTSVLQAALTKARAAKGTLRLVPGKTYVVSGALNPGGARIEGRGATLKIKNSTTPTYSVLVPTSACVIEDVTIDLNKANTTNPGNQLHGNGLLMNQTSWDGLVVRNVAIKNGHQVGVHIYGPGASNADAVTYCRTVLENVTVEACTAANFSIKTVRGVTMRGCRSLNAGGPSIYLSVVGESHVLGCESRGGAGSGIFLEYCQSVTVADGIFESNTMQGIAIGGGSDTLRENRNITVTGNVSRNNGSIGITVDPTKAAALTTWVPVYVTLANNIVTGNGATGINLENAAYVSITGNVSHGNTGTGLRILGAYCNASGNVLTSNTQYGLALYGVATKDNGHHNIGVNTVLGNTVGQYDVAAITGGTVLDVVSRVPGSVRATTSLHGAADTAQETWIGAAGPAGQAGIDIFGEKFYRPSTGVLRTSSWLQVDGTLKTTSSAWNTAHFTMGTYEMWIDSSGRLRIKNGAPTSDTDGTVVGTQT